MEVALPGALASLDCEDMFKELTKKLYGEEGALEFPERVEQDEGSLLKPEDHITAFGLAALMQNGFPPPGILHANFQPKTNPAAEDKWSASEESLQWTNSRIATYNPAQKLFKCVDCECVGFLSRIAEHWLGTHSNARVFQCPQCAYGSAWARCVRLHLVREHNMPDDRSTDVLVKNNPVLDEVTKYLQRLKSKIDSMSPVAPPPQANQGRTQQSNSPPAPPGTVANKRYGCPACPYATDRRDLFTRHENIHRDEKPFECYVCQKQFNRADHVKKHFLRMHRDHPYDLNRIRRQIPKSSYYPKLETHTMNQGIVAQEQQSYSVRTALKQEHNMHQIKLEHDQQQQQQQQQQGIMSKHPKKKGEKRYTCCYCPWSGVDNWCLKRHLNTHLKPFVCALCDYKAARSERLATHVTKVHNKKACGKCSFLAEDQTQLTIHLQEQHHVENRNIKVPNTMLRAGYSGGPTAPVMTSFGSGDGGCGSGSGGMASVRTWRPPKQQGAARLFNYMEASDGSDQEDFDGKVYPTDERSVQDFPKAGDVGTAAAEKQVGDNNLSSSSSKSTVTASASGTVTSPAQISTKRPPKKKPSTSSSVPKKTKSCNKENKNSKSKNKAKKPKASNEQHQQHSNKSSQQRSPLLAANSDHNKFDFDVEWDENGKKRPRKQSQPKRVIQDEDDGRDISDMIGNNPEITVTRVDTDSSEPKRHSATVLLRDKTNSDSSPPSSKIDCIISKIAEQKVIEAKESGQILPLKLCESLKMQAKKTSFKGRRQSIIILNKLKSVYKKSVIFKCKRCRLKFKPNYEFYLHYRYCKRKKIKSKMT